MAIRKSVIKYEVIYDDEECSLDCVSLEEIAQMTSDGPASGRFLDSDEEILTNEEAYKALEEQGSDPEFLNLHKCTSCDKVIHDIDGLEDGLCSECGY